MRYFNSANDFFIVMKFSIIIPVYNVEKYLRKCLDSVMAQTYPSWEAICVNDGSTDNSLEILKEYASKDDRFKIIHQSNLGVSEARNTGMRAAKGEYICFLDSDDWIDTSSLENLDIVLTGEDILCFGGAVYENDNDYYNQPELLCDEEFADGWSFYCKHACENRQLTVHMVPNKCYRRDFLLQNDMWFYPGILHEDNIFVPLVYYHAKRVTQKRISTPIYYYRIRPYSTMTTKSKKRTIDTVFVANYLSDYFIPIPNIEKTAIYRIINDRYLSSLRGSNLKIDKELKRLIKWECFRKVSRTKSRHRVLFFLARVSPPLLRFMMNHHIV